MKIKILPKTDIPPIKIIQSIDDIEKSYLTGQWLNIPAGKIHSVETKTDVILLELWKK